MDTEFPGVVYNLEKIKKDFYYKTLKINVNSTKLIQLPKIELFTKINQ